MTVADEDWGLRIYCVLVTLTAMNITVTQKELKVDGVTVANITDFKALFSALTMNLGKKQVVYLVLSYLGEARTSTVAKMLGMDRANASKVLERLEDEGLVEVVDDAHTLPDGRGRPSRLWAVVQNGE